MDDAQLVEDDSVVINPDWKRFKLVRCDSCNRPTDNCFPLESYPAKRRCDHCSKYISQCSAKPYLGPKPCDPKLQEDSEEPRAIPARRKFKWNQSRPASKARASKPKEFVLCPNCDARNPKEFPLETCPPQRRCNSCTKLFYSNEAKPCPDQ